MIQDIEEEKRKLAIKKEKIQIREKLLREKERKKRARRFEEIGKMAFKTNIDTIEKDALVGAFIEIYEQQKDDATRERWKRKSEEFAKKEEKTDATPLSVKFTNEPTKNTTDKLKELNFKWNRFRKEYYGYGSKERLEQILEGNDFLIEVLD